MINFQSGTQLLGGKRATVPQASAPAQTPPAPNRRSFNDQMGSIWSQMQNSSDQSGVMQAAMQGLSAMRPDIAAQLQGLPPERQSQVLMAYVNAVRSGKQFSAHEAAAGEFSNIQQQTQQAQQAQQQQTATPATKPLGMLAGLSNRITGRSGGLASPGERGGVSGESTSSGTTGIGIGAATDANRSFGLNAAKNAVTSPSLSGMAAGLVGGPVASAALAGYKAVSAFKGATSKANAAALSAVNATNDPIGALNAIQGWTASAPARAAESAKSATDQRSAGSFNRSRGGGSGGQGGYGAGVGRSDSRGSSNSAHGGDGQA